MLKWSRKDELDNRDNETPQVVERISCMKMYAVQLEFSPTGKMERTNVEFFEYSATLADAIEVQQYAVEHPDRALAPYRVVVYPAEVIYTLQSQEGWDDEDGPHFVINSFADLDGAKKYANEWVGKELNWRFEGTNDYGHGDEHHPFWCSQEEKEKHFHILQMEVKTESSFVPHEGIEVEANG